MLLPGLNHDRPTLTFFFITSSASTTTKPFPYYRPLRSSSVAGAKMRGKSFEEFHAQRLKTVPAGCFGDPAEFGALCAFVCSVHAARFAADKLNKAGGVLGRKVEIVSADSELKPDVATRRANHLLLGDKVDVLAALLGQRVPIRRQARSHHHAGYDRAAQGDRQQALHLRYLLARRRSSSCALCGKTERRCA